MDRKEKTRKLNALYARQGSTANQVRKYTATLRAQGINPNQMGFGQRRY